MKITNSKWLIAIGVLAIALSACSSATPTPTRGVATQTPWIIERIITATPEPAIATPLPTVGAPPTEARVATRTPTRPVARPATTKPLAVPPSPVAVAPTAVPAPICTYGPITLKEPEDNALRRTKEIGVGGDTFRFIWEPPPELQGDVAANVGYKLVMTARKNGATLYISHNKFLRDGKLFIFDKPDVSGLAGGEKTMVTWNVTIVQASGAISESDPKAVPPGVVACGPVSPTRNIILDTY
ncbi:MAG: hypothetical protein HZC40_16980 [Chloroflexi bacterium]|nr:hypothetical protein [Chloroflexota bacterium]